MYVHTCIVMAQVDGDGRRVGFNTNKEGAIDSTAPLLVWMDRRSAR
jgi:hypothetical protein